MNEFLLTVFWSGITVAIFFGWHRLFLVLKHPLLQPVLWTTVTVALLLALAQHPVSNYHQETAPLGWLLGPAVVAMAIPIWERRELIIAHWRPLLLVVVLGVAFSAASVLLLAPLVGWQGAKSLAPKSVTTQVAVEIVEAAYSGTPPPGQLAETLLAMGLMTSALYGAVLGPVVLRLAGVRDHRAVGLALGCSSGGIGAARAFQIDATAGAFASVGMSLTAICAGLILPCLLRLL
jgi:putative effector of murein hydrolase